MTETEIQTEKVKAVPEEPVTSPRKRRRRAPTTGAADDCFACQERHTKCDRRRPYCTQCLDQGKDCSGYKTTLTWGVGVASRGKLRGLALPIAKSRKVDQGSDVKTDNKKKNLNSPNDLTKLGPTRENSQHSNSTGHYSPPNSASTPHSARSTTFNFVNMDPSMPTPSPMLPPPSFDWRAPPAPPMRGDGVYRPNLKRPRRHSLQPLQVPALHDVREMGAIPMTANVLGGFRDHDFGVQPSPVASTFSGTSAMSPTYKDYYAHQPLVDSPCEGNFFTGHETLNWPRENMSSSLSSDQSSRDFGEDDAFYADPIVANTLDNLLTTQQTLSHHDLSVTCGQEELELPEEPKYLGHSGHPSALVPDDCGAHTSLSVPRPLSSLSIGKTPGLQFLINYFDKVISPVIVAFDSPTNPYRSHILRLAVGSETLQHAIAALSASNLRIRREHNASGSNRSTNSSIDSSHHNSVRKSSMAHSVLDISVERPSHTSAGEPSMEELYHKGVSIKALNEQLADPQRRQDDSILATLLILCLYHICDTGVAKFKTQFAGVKKILALRAGNKGCNSRATHWLTIMFTWFDAMTATVNDREGQLSSDDLHEIPLNDDDWALENLAGCDGRLFRTIAKLGRLNLLSQNKPVGDGPRPRNAAPSHFKRTPSPGSKTLDYYSMNYTRFDGNGWSAMLDDTDDLFPDDVDNNACAQFWKEWAEVRKALEDWQLDPSTSSRPTTSQGDRKDLYHISESFRHSALLYTERLAYPALPSAAPNFQHLVTQSLYHIAHVKSDVFLLWPLFITGTECVTETGRHLIKERCLDIQKDSGFFNNISGLELLEKVWRDDVVDARGGCLGLGGGFKWRRAMESVDGEYIVV